MANSKLFLTDNNFSQSSTSYASSQSYQSSTIKKGSLTRIKESKWAINFISKLIYWFNFLRIYFQKNISGRKPGFLLVEDCVDCNLL